MAVVTAAEVRSVVQAVLRELGEPARGASPERPPAATAVPVAPPTAGPPFAKQSAAAPAPAPLSRGRSPDGVGQDIEVGDPTVPTMRHRLGVREPADGAGLDNLMASTTARIGVGRAGPRPRTRALLLFQADHAVTQDAIFGDVPTEVLAEFDLFVVGTRVSDQDEYLLRPDLGRLLSEEGRAVVAERCVKKPQVQIVVGDGLSAAAVTNNLPKIYPVLVQGLVSAGVSVGTPFFVHHCRVGIINDVNAIVGADVVVLLIGERPGLGVADALSVYSGWRPEPGKTDAHRDVVCMITENGGTNPLEAGAFVVEHVRTVLAHQASGVELRLQLSQDR